LRLATLIVESGRAGAVVQAGRLGEVR